jgi:hypothetical protein
MPYANRKAEGVPVNGRRTRLRRALAGGAATALLAAAAVADDTPTRTSTSTMGTIAASRETLPAPSAPAAVTPGTPAGLRAFIDPETGRLTANPTRAQLQSTPVERRATALSRSTVGLRAFELSRGGQGLHLDGRFQTAIRVERQPDGSFEMTCSHGDTPADGHTHDASAKATPVR